MADIYSELPLSPRKKKRCPPTDPDQNTLTPKKMRIAPPTPPPSSRKGAVEPDITLPSHLTRLESIQTALQQSLSHALATCAVSPSSDTGIVRNVLNHISLTTYTGLPTQFTTDDLRRLCWLWEWDGKSKVDGDKAEEEDENPFLDAPPPQTKDWTRGSMGFVISSATHFSKGEGRRVPAYGIGIEVEMNIDKEMGGGMAAVARWTAAAETRRREFHVKLLSWVKLHEKSSVIPSIPLADLPKLSVPAKTSSLTKIFASVSPKAVSSSRSTTDVLQTPSSPSRSPRKLPPAIRDEFAMPAPITPSSRLSSPNKRRIITSSPSKNTVLFPTTPSSHSNKADELLMSTTRTPVSSNASVDNTPRGRQPIPQTPTTSRREALYERIRQRSLSASPSKRATDIHGNKLSQDQLLKHSQDEMRRKCLLGRLGGVAESVWMLFSASTSGSTATPSTRKRRALPKADVASAIVKSSPVPISIAEANESLDMLTKLCPFFLKPLSITGESWLEMPSSLNVDLKSPSNAAPSSPGGKVDSAQELLTRSPKRVKKEAGGLREVREIIRRELELQD
ncbi:hypothetical protein Moror_17565 [Moniliophthora roreri MCA 2997]|uniref:DNA replication factor Cdt1 C-terminal domain-containing protein n=2 Tax=Moniliophthora roreri TaxID=221103 RepID=V2XYG4_MONRO|nr:hypothetical protein Moror_17565 [Moniliophthora roreri MCA 2997]KAI3612395.1 hypothetical protein WG66_009925 [Moniliophthora roreri]